ncbi:MAG: hypothetical protein GY716_25410 [bacterium]|nr:hypothetical protein [bacterium]
MTETTSAATGWLIDGFQAWVVFCIWCAAVVLYGLYRAVAKPDADAIRPSGPGV